VVVAIITQAPRVAVVAVVGGTFTKVSPKVAVVAVVEGMLTKVSPKVAVVVAGTAKRPTQPRTLAARAVVGADTIRSQI
jgi:hypothetical protein